MHIGVTGTDNINRVTEYQKGAVWDWLNMLKEYTTFVHHGDCIGVDHWAHLCAIRIGSPVIIHPPIDHKKRAFCEGASHIRIAKPFLVRDKELVDEVNFLITLPKEDHEILRSGTWATFRYARKKGIPILVVYGRQTILYDGAPRILDLFYSVKAKLKAGYEGS